MITQPIRWMSEEDTQRFLASLKNLKRDKERDAADQASQSTPSVLEHANSESSSLKVSGL
jgi:hypothetical protein